MTISPSEAIEKYNTLMAQARFKIAELVADNIEKNSPIWINLHKRLDHIDKELRELKNLKEI